MAEYQTYSLHPSEIRSGDRILGTDMVVDEVKFGTMAERGSDNERAKWIIVMRDGRKMPTMGDSKHNVIRVLP